MAEPEADPLAADRAALESIQARMGLAPPAEDEEEDEQVTASPESEAEAKEDEQPEAEADEAEPKAERKGMAGLSDDQIVGIRRAKVPQAVLDGLDDAALTALADRMASMVADQDRAFERLNNPKHQTTPRASAEAEEVPARLPPSEPAELRARAETAVRAMGLTDSEAKPLVDLVLEGERGRSALEKRLVEIEGSLKQAERATLQERVESAFNELRTPKQFPQLASPEKRREVFERAIKRERGYDLTRKDEIHQCLYDAAVSIYGTPKPKAPATQEPPQRAKPAQPTKPTTRQPAKEKPKTQEETDSAVVAHIFSPDWVPGDMGRISRATGINT